jgi:hypothetical protein
MMMMHPAAVAGGDKGINRILLPGGMAHHFTAFADALVRLDVGTGGNLLQEYLDGFSALLAFEGQGACWLGWHGE